MSGIYVEVIGGDRVKAVLRRVIDGMDEKVSAALREVAEVIKEDAKTLCPVDTGSLRASIRREAVARPAGDIWEVGVRAGGYVTNPKTRRKVDYAKYVEFGTSRTRPKPFLRPATLSNRAKIEDAIRRAVSEDVEEATGE